MTSEASSAPAPAAPPRANIVLNATLVGREDVNPDLSIFRVLPDSGVPEFKAGQYVALGLPAPDGGAVRRAYSIASPPKQREHLEFYIQLVHGGAFTPLLWELQEGARLWTGPKAVGKFTFDGVPEDAHVLMIGTGTGLAPYVAMLKEHMSCAHSARRLVVAHGARHARDLGYRLPLTKLDIECPNFLYAPTISRPTEGDSWVGHVGRVESLIHDGTLERAMGEKIEPGKFHIFLCGNPGMCEDMMDHFQELGFTEDKPREPGDLHFEKYW
jgi:ferredoxin--NADP+ reductase